MDATVRARFRTHVSWSLRFTGPLLAMVAARMAGLLVLFFTNCVRSCPYDHYRFSGLRPAAKKTPAPGAGLLERPIEFSVKRDSFAMEIFPFFAVRLCNQ
jgi:hypothetical protein